MSKDVAVLVGSIRAGSYSRKLAQILATLAPESLNLEIVEIGDLPLYNQDLDEDAPAAWTAFRERLKKADAFLFVTPEHNRSIPATLKNAVDIASRPYGQSGFSGKPGAIVSNSPGALGGFGANHHLRQCLTFLDVYTMQQPEAYIGAISTLLDEEGELNNERTKELLTKFMQAFAAWIKKTA